jgi:hypothetical protein
MVRREMGRTRKVRTQAVTEGMIMSSPVNLSPPNAYYWEKLNALTPVALMSEPRSAR